MLDTLWRTEPAVTLPVVSLTPVTNHLVEQCDCNDSLFVSNRSNAQHLFNMVLRYYATLCRFTHARLWRRGGRVGGD